MLHCGLTPDRPHTADQLTAAELREVKQSLELLMRVAKPAGQTPASILVLLELIEGILPEGVLNVVDGFGLEAVMPLA